MLHIMAASAREGRGGCRLEFFLSGSGAVAKLFAVVILVEGKAGAAGGNPYQRHQYDQIDEGVARRLKFDGIVRLVIANLDACSIVAVNWHQDHKCGLQERRDDDCQNDSNDLNPELVVLETEDNNKAKDSIGEVGNDPELEEDLELGLNTIICRYRAAILDFSNKVASFVFTASVVCCLGIHDSKESAH